MTAVERTSSAFVPSEIEQWRKKTPRCFFCLNVRHGTMILAIFQMLLHTIAICAILLAIFQPHFFHRMIPFKCLHHLKYDVSHLNHGGKFPNIFFHEKNDMGFDKIADEEHKSVSNSHNGQLVDEIHSLPRVSLKRSKFMEFLGPEHVNLPSHMIRIHLMSFGQHKTLIFPNKDKKHPTIFISRMFGFPKFGPLLHPAIMKPALAAADEPGSVQAMPLRPAAQMTHGVEQTAAPAEEDIKSVSHPEHRSGLFKWLHHHRCTKQRRFWDLVMVWLALGFCFLLYYGAKYNRPSYLLPYFVFQVFAYILIAFTVVGYLSYLPHAKLWISSMCYLPFKRHLMRMNELALGFLLLSCGVLVLALKAYLMGMVWACYRHLQIGLRLEQIVRQRRRAQAAEDVVLDLGVADKEKEAGGVVPPGYEKCLSIPVNSYMPPPYFESSTAGAAEEAVKEEQK